MPNGGPVEHRGELFRRTAESPEERRRSAHRASFLDSDGGSEIRSPRPARPDRENTSGAAAPAEKKRIAPRGRSPLVAARLSGSDRGSEISGSDRPEGRHRAWHISDRAPAQARRPARQIG